MRPSALLDLTLLCLAMLCAGSSIANAESQYFESNGVRLHYIDEGSGETVVLLHGFSGSAEGLYVAPGTVTALVHAGFRVIALDQVGHGKSDKPVTPERYGMQMVNDVHRLLEHVEADKVHLIGYSMGAKVANAFRDLHPEQLLSITLGGYGWPWQTPEMTYAEAEERLANRMVLPGNNLQALAAVSMTMHDLTLEEQSLRTNKTPAFAIIGDQDAAVPASEFARLEGTMTNLRTAIIPGTHAGAEGAPYTSRYQREIITFLETVPRANP